MPASTGLGDSRITASNTPPKIPMAIESTVRISVLRRPRSTGSENRYWPTTSHSKFGFVRNECTSIATSTAMTATATQRPGCRTGTAWSGRAGPASVWSATITRQPAAPLIFDVVIAPPETLHLSRIALYVPSVISACTAPWIALA